MLFRAGQDGLGLEIRIGCPSCPFTAYNIRAVKGRWTFLGMGLGSETGLDLTGKGVVVWLDIELSQ